MQVLMNDAVCAYGLDCGSWVCESRAVHPQDLRCAPTLRSDASLRRYDGLINLHIESNPSYLDQPIFFQNCLALVLLKKTKI
jgi:hypothetical protein